MKLNTSKFKKVHQDKDHTTMEDDNGHQLKIAHHAISSKYRKQLEILPMMLSQHGGSGNVADVPLSKRKRLMAEGGDTGPAIDPDKAKEMQAGATESGWQPDKWAKNVKEGLGMAEGGEADAQPSGTPGGEGSPYLDPDKAKEVEKGATSSGWQPGTWVKNLKEGLGLADGGYVPQNKPNRPGLNAKLVGASPYAKGGKVKSDDDLTGPKAFYADGGEAIDQDKLSQESADEQAQGAADSAPYGTSKMPAININVGGQGSPASSQPPVVAQPPATPAQAAINAQDDAKVQAAGTDPDDSTQSQPAGTSDSLSGVNPSATPDVMGGYSKEVAGLQQAGQAQASQAQAEEGIMRAKATAALNLQNDYQTHLKSLNDERQAWKDDIMNQHIDPNHYLGSMDTGRRLTTSIGLILGGIAGGGQSNQALDFLNKQIDRDIEAQRGELGKRENLLSANLHETNDLNQATEMTRMMMMDGYTAQLQQAAAKAASPIAKANALQAIGKIEQQSAPMVQQMAMRNALTKSGPGTLQNTDPASYVQWVVPPDRQKDVAAEIGNAQNANASRTKLMALFDQADKDNTLAGRAAHLGFQPASVLGMNALELPMIHDQEGRVNEYEQKTLQDLHPQPGDSQAKVAQKRQAYNQFIDGKMAAPNAKAFGIDLSKFRSTTHDPVGRLPDNQQQFVAWARANPQDPRSAQVLKKLGIQ